MISKISMEESLIRHMVFNSLRAYNRQFRSKYGKMVICCDNYKQASWRKEYFPFYKAHRKKDRDASSVDWKVAFSIFDIIRNELKEFFPYKIIDLPGAEADDIIAVLSERLKERTLIVSSDKDFLQLQIFDNVDQYSPILGKFIRSEDPIDFLNEHIIRGDRGDGIPNMLSEDSTFVSGGRQKSINSKKLNDWLSILKLTNQTPPFEGEELGGFIRNRTLIDLKEIPSNIISNIRIEFEKEPKKITKQEMLNFFISRGLRNLIEHLDEF